MVKKFGFKKDDHWAATKSFQLEVSHEPLINDMLFKSGELTEFRSLHQVEKAPNHLSNW